MLLVAGLCSKSRIYSYRQLALYKLFHREYHPVLKDLEAGRVHEGQTIEDLFSLKPPLLVEHVGDYTFMNYQPEGNCTGITIVARNDRLVCAQMWRCDTPPHTFFNSMTSVEENTCWRDYQDYKARQIALRLGWKPEEDPSPVK